MLFILHLYFKLNINAYISTFIEGILYVFSTYLTIFSPILDKVTPIKKHIKEYFLYIGSNITLSLHLYSSSIYSTL